MLRSRLGLTAMLTGALLLFGKPRDTLSQEPTRVEVGSRVRLKAEGAGQRWMVGKLLEFRSDSVRLLTGEPPTDSLALAFHSIESLERSRGQQSQAAHGAWVGLGAGAAVGLLLGAMTYEECVGCLAPDPGRAGSGLIGAVLGGLFGMGVGALIGRSVHAERWESVRQPWF